MNICKLALTFNMTVFLFSLNSCKNVKYLEEKKTIRLHMRIEEDNPLL